MEHPIPDPSPRTAGDPSDPGGASRRLARVERRQRWLAAAFLTLGAGWVGTAARDVSEVPDVLRARAVQMVDAEGRVRAELAIDDDGSAGLFVRDEEGRSRAVLVHDAAQSALYLLDEDGTIRVGSAQYAHGGGGFALHGPKSEGAAVLYLKDEGSLTFYGHDGAVLERIPLGEER